MLSQTVIDELAKSLTASSIKRYKSWSNIVSPKEYNIDNFINWYKKINEETKTKKDYSSILSVIIKVLSIEKQNADKYQKLLDEAKQSKDIFSKPSESDKQKQISIKQIQDLQDELMNNTKRNKRDDYGLQFVTMLLELAPFRTQDYVSVSFSADDTPNYVDLQNHRLVYTQGKSINSNRIIDIPEKLFHMIKDNKQKYDAKFLFPSFRMKTQSITLDGFVSFSKNLFKADVSPQILRQVFVSHYNDSNMSKKDRLVKSKQMGHALTTSQTQYTKFSTAIHDKDQLIADLQETIRQLTEQLKNK